MLRTYFDGLVPNQVLLNYYDVTDGIGYHNDGELYFPTAAILSVGESALLQFHPNSLELSSSTVTVDTSNDGTMLDLPKSASFYLPNNSLFVFSHSLYNDYQHGIMNTASFTILDDCRNRLDVPSLTDLRPPIITRQNPRWSLTFRRLRHVSKTFDEFGPGNDEERSELARRRKWWLQSITDDKS
jgi:hypothetical protein